MVVEPLKFKNSVSLKNSFGVERLVFVLKASLISTGMSRQYKGPWSRNFRDGVKSKCNVKTESSKKMSLKKRFCVSVSPRWQELQLFNHSSVDCVR